MPHTARGSRLDTTLAVPVKKRKATELIEVTTKKKFVFNKRGKLKGGELKELVRTNKNIFIWLKPTPAPVLKLAKVMEMEHTDGIEAWTWSIRCGRRGRRELG